jgi:beta-galactosidase
MWTAVPADSVDLETGDRVAAGSRYHLAPRAAAVFEVPGSDA